MVSINFAYIAVLLYRGLMLGGIVYYATSTIPSEAISPHNKLIIAAIVVIFYALLDYISSFFKSIRGLLCRAACGCSPYESYDLSLSTPGLGSPTSGMGASGANGVSAELDEAINQLKASTQGNATKPTDSDTESVTEATIKNAAECEAAKGPAPKEAINEGFSLF